MIYILTPAYGRDYKNKKDVLSDWDAGKDFMLNTLQLSPRVIPINKPQVPIGSTVQFRYARLQKVTVIKAR